MNKLKLKAFLFYLIFIVSTTVFGQETEKPRRWEVVLNITNAISRFSGNGTKNINEDPYLMAVKWRNKSNRHAIRFGFNQSYSSLTTQIFPGERRTRDFYFSPLIGFEWRRHIDKHFMFFYGLDARAGMRNGSVEIIDPGIGTLQVISAQDKGVGAGPFCGFVWKVNPRVSIFTEANFYAQYTTTYRYLDDGFTKTVLEDSRKVVFTPVIPTSIFVSIAF